MIEERIQAIRENLEEDPDQPYFGSTTVQAEYRRRYSNKEVPPVRTIGEVLSDLGLTKTTQDGSNKGATECLCYPEHTVYETLGDRVLEADFVGEKFLERQTEPLNFIGYSFKKDPRLRHYGLDGKRPRHSLKKQNGFLIVLRFRISLKWTMQ